MSDRPIKALTLWQPWASLIAWGEKQYETRSWSTEYRGLLAIHASKRETEWEYNEGIRDVYTALRTWGKGK